MYVMSDSGDEFEREHSRRRYRVELHYLKDLWEYVGLFRIGDRRRTTRKEQVLRRQRTDRATKVQIRRFLAPYREPYYTPGDKLMVRQLGGRFDEVTGASFPQEVIHRILSFVNEAGARVKHSVRQALPGWIVEIASPLYPTNQFYRVTTREQNDGAWTRQPFSDRSITARGEHVISRGMIYGPGY